MKPWNVQFDALETVPILDDAADTQTPMAMENAITENVPDKKPD
jgi:hypothetical protein